MNPLFKYEFKKIMKRKATIVAITCVFLCILLLSVLFISENYRVDENGNEITGLSAITLTKEQLSGLKDYLTTEKIAAVFAENQAVMNNPANYTSNENGDSYISNEAYGRYIEKNTEILNLIRRVFSPVRTYNYYILSSLSMSDMDTFYERRTENIATILNMDLSYGNYSEAEKEFFTEMNNKITTPYYFSYTKGWEDILSRGFLSITLLISIAICVCISPIFAFEYQTGADSIVLSTRYGKSKVITAKILAAVFFTTCLYFSAILFFSILMLCNYGITGWNVHFQIVSLLSPYALTMLQVYLYSLIIGYLVIMSSMSFNMLLSANMKTSFSVVVISIIWLLIPLFIPGSKSGLLFSRLMSLLPAKALEVFVLFSSYDIFELFGYIIPLPIAVIAFSSIVILVSLPFAYLGFKKHQVA